MRNPANKQTNEQTDRHTKVIAISRFSRDKYQINKKHIMKKIETECYYRNKTIGVYNLEI